MPEPTTTTATAVATLLPMAVSTSALTAFGVPLGLHADVLLAGFLGSVVAIILLNTVPGRSDTWQDLVRTSGRRLAVAWASSITAGYITPLVLLLANVPPPLLLGMAFVVGASAQHALLSTIRKFWNQAEKEG